MQKEIENLEFVQGVNFEFIVSLKHNGTKYLLIFDDSSEKICNSKAFVDFATAGRHRGLSTIFIEHHLFHQSKLGRDVELHNTHNVPLKSPRDVMQVTTLAHSWVLVQNLLTGIERQRLFPLVLCWLVCRLAETIDYVIVQTRDPFPQNFISPTGWNSQKIRKMNTQNLSTLQVFQSFYHKGENLFLQSCPKRVYSVSLRMHKKSAQRKPPKHKKHHVAKFWSKVRLLSLKRTTSKQRIDILASEKGLQPIRVNSPPVINHLSWYGAACPRSCFCVQQKFDYPVSYKAGTSKVSSFTKSHVPSWFT